MPLNIYAMEDYPPVDRLLVLLYGRPDAGKTTLAYSAKKPLVLDFDGGSRRVDNRTDCAVVRDWSEVAGITAADLEPYETVVVDTVGAMAKVLSLYIIDTVPKTGRDGNLWQQGYGELKSRLEGWTSHIRSLDKHLVFLAHTSEVKVAEQSVERIILPGSFKEDLYGMADMIGRVEQRGGARDVLFNTTDACYGKNPGRLPATRVPDVMLLDGLLGKLIDQTMQSMNDDGEEAAKQREHHRQAWQRYVDHIHSIEDLAAFNVEAAQFEARTDLTNKQRKAGYELISAAAPKRGWIYDQAAGVFVTKEAS